MKAKNWVYLALIGLCVVGFLVYASWESSHTDTTPPQVYFAQELPALSAKDGDAALLADVTATDDVSGDVTDLVVVEKIHLDSRQGLATVTYAAFDEAGNVTKVSRQIQYTDYEGPRFSLSSPLMFTYGYSFNLLKLVSAEDPLDGDISGRIRATSLDADAITQQGMHDVMLRVTNSLGHTVELTVPVEVGSFSGYGADMELTNYLVYCKQGDSFQAEAYLQSFTAGREEIALDGAVPQGYSLKLSGEVDTSVAGVYSLTYELTQDNSGYTAISRLIVVVEE